MQPKSIDGLIRALLAEGVEFVVIGGMADACSTLPVALVVHRRGLPD